MSEFPILEFDPEKKANIEPRHYATQSPIPPGVVLCFFHEVLRELVDAGTLQTVGHFGTENGPMPIYELEFQGGKVTVMNPFVGAPIAAGILEELIAHGGQYCIAVGGAGALKKELVESTLVIPTAAVRDEGVSYHYLPPSREATPHPTAVQAIVDTLKEHQIPFHFGKTWTTSAFYRETVARRDQRLAEGCEVVEMEAAAFFAVAQFRGIPMAQFLYAGDLVVPEGWDGRAWNNRLDHRRNLFWLAVEACIRLGRLLTDA
ncbi:MAG: nucleoside phosphorylase [Anaerolineae bacterium]|nr:nucleoside phosphorylase [Anaerolineae bacterium]